MPNRSGENLTADEVRQRAATLWSGALAVEALPTPWARLGRCQDPR
ncbi:MAG: hypothetical protein GDA40_11365 [Rhodobacteraceae bacterium]|nr:hypothetical protein [Paracoccaceae bacterium]